MGEWVWWQPDHQPRGGRARAHCHRAQQLDRPTPVKRGWQEFSLVAYSITLSGQDITSHVDQMSIKIEDALGQGAGAGSSGATQGRAATFTFNTDLGPMNNAVGAGKNVFGSQPPTPWRKVHLNNPYPTRKLLFDRRTHNH